MIAGSLLLAAPSVPASEHVFKVVAPEKVPFNYPAPPQEGGQNYFSIAQNGQARCVIVREANAAPAQKATVEALQSYLDLATSANIPIITDEMAVPDGMATIHVGETTVGRNTPLNLPEVDYGNERLPNIRGYLIKTLDPSTLVIRGASEKATANGVVSFLKRYVGIRQYWPGLPGDLGDVIPSRPTLSVPQVEWRDWPYFYSAIFFMRPFPGKTRPKLDFYRLEQTLACSENYDRWLSPIKYGQTHPEYFSLINGVRAVPADDVPADWQPCVSNPDVLRIMSDAVIDYFRQNPEAPGINLSINDGGQDCTCASCRAMDAPNADYSLRLGMSDRYVKFTNQVQDRVAREFPSKWIVYLAYAAAQPAPTTVKPNPKLLPVLTSAGNYFETWDSWMKTGAPHMGLYLHRNAVFSVLPKLDLHQTVRRIRYTIASGRARVYLGELDPQWPFDDTVPYVVSELLWDPRQDVDALLAQYYSSFYGPAAGPMRAFHQTIESGYERWLDEEGEPHWFGKDISSDRHKYALEQFRVLSPKEATRAAAELDQAVAAAKSDSRVLKRIQVVRYMFHLQELGTEWAWAALRLRETPCRSTADAWSMVKDTRTIFALSREMRRYIEETLEQPPASAYSLFKLSLRGPATPYEEMKSGEPGPEIRGAIDTGINAAAVFLRQKLGPEKAAVWWSAASRGEKEPVLSAAFRTAEARARGSETKNLLADPGFEEIGRELAPHRDVVLNPELIARLGVRLIFPDRSPNGCVLSDEHAHSGDHSLMLEHCDRTRFSRTLPVQPGKRYRVGLWLKRNQAEGNYKFVVDARLTDGSHRTLSSSSVADKLNGWQELVAEVMAPPRAASISLRLFVDAQAPEARCWIDDAFIGVQLARSANVSPK